MLSWISDRLGEKARTVSTTDSLTVYYFPSLAMPLNIASFFASSVDQMYKIEEEWPFALSQGQDHPIESCFGTFVRRAI